MRVLEGNILETITERLVREFAPDQIMLFGSHAWGSPGDDSDVDLLVIVSDSGLSASRRSQRAHRCLGGLNVPKDVLVQTRAEVDRALQVRTSLVRRIFEQGKLLYDRTSAR